MDMAALLNGMLILIVPAFLLVTAIALTAYRKRKTRSDD